VLPAPSLYHFEATLPYSDNPVTAPFHILAHLHVWMMMLMPRSRAVAAARAPAVVQIMESVDACGIGHLSWLFSA